MAGSTVTAGPVISSSARSASALRRSCRARPRCPPAGGSGWSYRSGLASRSVSETTPTTAPPSSTGTAPMRWSDSSTTIRLYGVSSSTVTTSLVITSETAVRVMGDHLLRVVRASA